MTRDGKEISLLGFGSHRVLPKVRFGSVRFKFFARMENLGSFLVVSVSSLVRFCMGSGSDV